MSLLRSRALCLEVLNGGVGWRSRGKSDDRKTNVSQSKLFHEINVESYQPTTMAQLDKKFKFIYHIIENSIQVVPWNKCWKLPNLSLSHPGKTILTWSFPKQQKYQHLSEILKLDREKYTEPNKCFSIPVVPWNKYFKLPTHLK